MGKIKLPEWVEALPNGPHKKDVIRGIKRERRKEWLMSKT